MAKLITTKCDFCGLMKKDGEQWWKVVQDSYLLFYEEGYAGRDAKDFTLLAAKDACSPGCCIKALGQFLDRKTVKNSEAA